MGEFSKKLTNRIIIAEYSNKNRTNITNNLIFKIDALMQEADSVEILEKKIMDSNEYKEFDKLKF